MVWTNQKYHARNHPGKKSGGKGKRWEDDVREWTGMTQSETLKDQETKNGGENWLTDSLCCPNEQIVR